MMMETMEKSTMKKRRSLRGVSLAFVMAASMVTSVRADAAVLQQKWVAGQKLPYDVTLDGTMNIQAGDGAPGMLGLMAGLPFEIKVDGSGQAIFDTRSVDEQGVGTVAVLVPQLKVNGSAFGMQGALDVKDGKAVISMGGKAMGNGARPVPQLSDPAFGLRFSPLGRFEGAVALKTPEPATDANGMAEKARDAKDDAGKPTGASMDRGIGLGVGGANPAVLLQSLPQLWPGRDVKTGETWTLEPTIPIPHNGPVSGPPAPLSVSLGTITMKLLGQETVAGRVSQHIDVRGTLVLDKAKAAILNAANTDPNRPRLNSARSVINGDIWLDADAGQIVRVLLKVQLQSSSTGTAPAKEANAKPQTFELAQDFNGTLQMRLGKVMLAQATAQATTTQAANAQATTSNQKRIVVSPSVKTPIAKAPIVKTPNVAPKQNATRGASTHAAATSSR